MRGSEDQESRPQSSPRKVVPVPPKHGCSEPDKDNREPGHEDQRIEPDRRQAVTKVAGQQDQPLDSGRHNDEKKSDLYGREDAK